MVDFKKLRAGKAKPSPINLRGKLVGINDLYASQAEVLDTWHGRRHDKDVVVKLHTGGGKTLVALLMAQSVMNETSLPVLYLTPTNQLVGHGNLRTDCKDTFRARCRPSQGLYTLFWKRGWETADRWELTGRLRIDASLDRAFFHEEIVEALSDSLGNNIPTLGVSAAGISRGVRVRVLIRAYFCIVL